MPYTWRHRSGKEQTRRAIAICALGSSSVSFHRWYKHWKVSVLHHLLELVGDLGASHGGGASRHEHGARDAHSDSGSNHVGLKLPESMSRIVSLDTEMKKQGDTGAGKTVEAGDEGVGGERWPLTVRNFSVELLRSR